MSIISSGQITITDLSDGKDGVGIQNTDITYANSTSGTTAPTTGWTSSVPSLVKGQYLWTKTVWTYTDNSSETGYSVSYISKDGTKGTDGTSGIIVSSVAPTSPQTGQLWQDISTTPQLIKKWTGSEWVIWELYAQNLKADSLSALSANLGDVSAGTYTSWSIEDYEVYDYLSAIYMFKGGIRFLAIENPNTTDPDTSGVASGKMIRGQSIISGIVRFYQQLIPLGDSRTANEILKEVNGFWTPYGDVGGYCGSIGSYKNADRIGQLILNADLIRVNGKLETNAGIISNSSSITVSLFYGITAVFKRQGNLVVVTFNRQHRTIGQTGDNLLIAEKVPSGYRPSYSHYFGINRNSGTNILKDLVMGIESNGDVRVTIGETGAAMFAGSTSYFTKDPLP